MSTLKLFDVHTHTQFVAFKDETDAAIKRALDAGIWLVNIGTQRDTSAKAIEIANKYPEGVYATVGLHPIHTEKSYHDEQELGIMNKELGNDSGFVSRGEDFDYEYYKKLGTHLSTAVNTYNTAYKELGKIDKDVVRITDGERSIEPILLEKPRIDTE